MRPWRSTPFKSPLRCARELGKPALDFQGKPLINDLDILT